MIDLYKSYIFLHTKTNIVKYSISSVLYDINENKEYYTLKECISEGFGKNPFEGVFGYEYQGIIQNDKKLIAFRTAATNPRNNKFNFSNKSFRSSYNYSDSNNFSVTNKIKNKEYKQLSFDQVLKKLRDFDTDDFYCKIEYKLENKDYIAFFKCQYLNFGKSEDYLQPIHGYIPFKFKKNLYLSYFVKNIKAGTNEQNNLNVMYGDYNPIYNGFKLASKNKMISFMKKIVNLIFPNVYNYDNYLNINESKIFFFTDS